MKRIFLESKLGELLSALDKKSRKDLQYFLRMPSLHLKPYEILIFEHIVGLSHKKGLNAFSVASLKASLPEYAVIIEKQWNYIKSNLYKALSKYLMMQIAHNNQLPISPLLLDYFLSKKLLKNHHSYFNQISQLLEKNHSSEDYYLHKYYLSRIKIVDKRRIRKDDKNFSSHLGHLDNFYLENRLRLICEQVNRGQIINNDYLLANRELLVRHFQPRKSSSYSVRAYFFILLMLTNREQGDYYYFKCRSILRRKNVSSISTKDRNSILEYLLNYCILCLNTSRIEAAREYISMIKFAQKAGLLLISNEITSSRYKNTITCAILAGNDAWVARFADQFAKHLSGPNTEDIIKYNRANIAFHYDDVTKALMLLSQFQPFDLYYKIGYEKLLIKIYYELNDIDALNYRLKSFQVYINTKVGIPPHAKLLFRKFIRMMQNLMAHEDIDLSELKKTMPLTDLEWLIRKKRSADSQHPFNKQDSN